MDLFSFHLLNTKVFLANPLAITLLHGVTNPHLNIVAGAGVGTAMGVAQFSSTAFLSAINSDILGPASSGNFSEPGTVSLNSTKYISEDGKWHETTLVSMHNDDFWSQFMHLVVSKFNPIRQYAILIQATSDSNAITVGSAVLVDSSTSVDWFKNYFVPILIQKEEEYDEYFDLEARVRVCF